MANFPSKLYSLKESIIFKMLLIKKELLHDKKDILYLYQKLEQQNNMDLSDYIDALSCLYAIGEVEIIENQINLISNA